MPPVDLSWVDEFIERVRPYVFVRLEDRVLIKRPNQAQKLNESGARILKALLDGGTVAEVLDAVGREPGRVRDVAMFLLEVKRFTEGRLDDACRSDAVEVRRFDLGFSELPILSEVALTYRCNLRCSFCYAGCNCTVNPAGDDREMTADEVRAVLRKIRHQAQVPSVSFTGGEPTLRRDLPDLVRFAKELGLWVNLITNGTCVGPRLAGRLADAGLDSAQVSLEGITAATHDRVTGIPGSFPHTVAAVGYLERAGIRAHTNTTMNRDNLHECDGMPRFVKDRLGSDRFSMNLVVPTGSAAVHAGVALRYGEVGPYIERVAAESERVGVEFMWYSTIPMCMFNTVAHGLGNKGCSACDGLLSVAPNGDVLPCASFDESVGNLLERDAVSIWNGPRARRHRDKRLAHPECRACSEFAICHGGCPLYWRTIGFGELERVRGFLPAAVAGLSR